MPTASCVTSTRRTAPPRRGPPRRHRRCRSPARRSVGRRRGTTPLPSCRPGRSPTMSRRCPAWGRRQRGSVCDSSTTNRCARTTCHRGDRSRRRSKRRTRSEPRWSATATWRCRSTDSPPLRRTRERATRCRRPDWEGREGSRRRPNQRRVGVRCGRSNRTCCPSRRSRGARPQRTGRGGRVGTVS